MITATATKLVAITPTARPCETWEPLLFEGQCNLAGYVEIDGKSYCLGCFLELQKLFS